MNSVAISSKQSIQEQIALVQSGNEAAFKELYEDLSDRLFRYIHGRTKHREHALDILQEVFIDLWGAMSRFRYKSDGQFYGFVFLITKRRLAKYYRKTKGRETIEFDETHMGDHTEFDEHAYSNQETLRHVMPRLTDDHRDVLELRYWSGLPFKDIAEMLDVKETTVKVRHHRALKSLATHLIDYEI